ncbi:MULTISPECIES: hypothetical protein [Haloarcula]|uniref:hypothetical protein n=1 Tax=Haloarcula TaxID=2237 RepID=UPI0023E890BC|nr:hypothetical protein [Halomicroarcula sp. SHR3]
MVETSLPRRYRLLAALALAAVTGLAVTAGWSVPLLAFVLVGTAVFAVGVSETVAEVAPWYYVFQSAILSLFGVGLVLTGYGTLPVLGLTAAFALLGVLSARRYSRLRRTTPQPETDP